MKLAWLIGLALTVLVSGAACLAQEQEEPPTIASTVDGFASVDSMIRMLTVVEDTLKKANIDPAQRLFSCNVGMGVYRHQVFNANGHGWFDHDFPQTYLTVHISADDFVSSGPVLLAAVGAPVKHVHNRVGGSSRPPGGIACGFQWGPQVNCGQPFLFEWNTVDGTKDRRVDPWYRSLPEKLRSAE